MYEALIKQVEGALTTLTSGAMELIKITYELKRTDTQTRKERNTMYETLKQRVEEITNDYAELVSKRVKAAKTEEITRQEMYSLTDSVVGLTKMIDILESTNRISPIND